MENAEGKEPYEYFKTNSIGKARVSLILQNWIRYSADSFESNDKAYSLHKTLEDLVKFQKKIKKENWRQPASAHNPATVYVTKKTAEKLKRDRKYDHGVFITTY